VEHVLGLLRTELDYAMRLSGLNGKNSVKNLEKKFFSGCANITQIRESQKAENGGSGRLVAKI
jgi:hypothetical protein